LAAIGTRKPENPPSTNHRHNNNNKELLYIKKNCLIEAKGFVYDDLHGVGSDRLSGRYVAAGREGNVVDGLTLLTVRNLNSIKEKLE
jgi:hypothetical protein